jgi:hypothetical protein
MHAGDPIRALAPHVLEVYQETRETVLESGIVERRLKELCALHLAEREEVFAQAGDPGAVARDSVALAGDPEIDAGDPSHFDERQSAALAWANAIAWDSGRADDALWRRLHRAFTEPELVELGYSIALMLGQQHWLATHGVVERPDPRTS